tara:strand:+ start:4596 stop:5621 length:1026 start_codon:yes stop_codon:yes gene_type:complete
MEAMELINKNGVRTLLVTDRGKNLLGTISDGDIRRTILSNKGALDVPIKNSFNRDAVILRKGKFKSSESAKLFKKNKFDLIPVVDNNNIVVDILFWDSLFKPEKKEKNKKLDLPVVIMAGGRGSRISEFTDILPKPLIPLKKKPIIEHIIEKFLRYKIKDFYVTTNYKSELLKAYFKELSPSYNINFFEEKIPLGTVGGLSGFKRDLKTDFFLSNCDIVIDADYAEIISLHKNNDNLMTLVISANNTELAYGVCDLDDKGNLLKINEKPNLNYLVNTGFYLMSPRIFKYINKNEYLDIDVLINKALENKEKVGVFPIHNSGWSDVGQWHEYVKTLGKKNVF